MNCFIKFPSNYKIFLPVDIREINININFTRSYTLLCIGVLENGEKAYCFITDIKPFFDVEVLDDTFIQYLDSSEFIELNKFKREIIYLKQFKYYTPKKKQYLRYYFDNLNQRTKWLKYFESSFYRDCYPYTLCENDNTCYYRKFARENKIKLNEWISLENITTFNIQQYKSFLKPDIKNIFVLHYTKIVNVENIYSKDGVPVYPILEFSWDIETYTKSNKVPSPDNPNDIIFMISCCLYWAEDTHNSLYKNFVITTLCFPNEFITEFNNINLIYCKTEEQLIMTFLKIIETYKPLIAIGFNDFSYDWPFVINKISQYSLENIIDKISPYKNFSYDIEYKKYVRELNIKIEADRSMNSKFLNMPGLVCIDIRIECMKGMPTTEESSLKYFLKLYSLQPKIDIQISVMKELYENIIGYNKWDYSLLKIYYEKWHTLIRYSMVDSLSCHNLATKRVIYTNLRELANISFISFSDAFYYAGGVKVKNLLMSEGSKEFSFNVKYVQNTNNEKFPGALVVEPKTCLYKYHKDTPVISLDISSLYPNIIITFNLSQECIITDNQELVYDEDKYYPHYIEIEYSSGRKISGYVLRYKNIKHMGLMARVLLKLYNFRMDIKKEIEVLENIKIKNEDIILKIKNLNAKQYAVKIIMNTFYGEAGNSVSILYIPLLAAGVTNLGQFILKSCIKWLEERNNKILYGDTDSVYYCKPFSYYDDIVYDSNNTEQYWIDLINKSITYGKLDQVDINEYLCSLTNHNYIKMAFEQITFPLLMIEKKHYVGIAYSKPTDNIKASVCNDVNIFKNSKSLLIKGLEIKKRGIAEYTKMCVYNILMEILSLHNMNTLEQIIKTKYIELTETCDVPMQSFVKTNNYKETQHCNYIGMFIERLKKNNYPNIPKINERFNYVVVLTNEEIKGYGKCNSVKISDKMEIYEEGKYYNIDKHYYNKDLRNNIISFIKGLPLYKDKSNSYLEKIIVQWSAVNSKLSNKTKRIKFSIEDIMLVQNENMLINIMLKHVEITASKKFNIINEHYTPSDNDIINYETFLRTNYSIISIIIDSVKNDDNVCIETCKSLFDNILINNTYFHIVVNYYKYLYINTYNVTKKKYTRKNTIDIIHNREKIFPTTTLIPLQ